MNTWLKIKQESAGYTSDVTTPEQKADYIRKYKQKENINLHPALIMKNPGRKATAKLMLNSFWGNSGKMYTNPPQISSTSFPTSYLTFIKSESTTRKVWRSSTRI